VVPRWDEDFSGHTTFDCKYHLGWITRAAAANIARKCEQVGRWVGSAVRVRELIRGIGKEHEVEILKSQVSKDHVHLFVSVPPPLAMSKLAAAAAVQYLKGKSTCKLLSENQ
jgi:putative transposase